MRFTRDDYQHRILDTCPPDLGGIHPEEPVFLLRGQDALASKAVLYYAKLLLEAQAAPDMVRRCLATVVAMQAWPDQKLPDLPGFTGGGQASPSTLGPGALRLGKESRP
jgi:hypothetical protein